MAFDPNSKTVIFVEVKLRKKNSLTSPEETITERKMSKIRTTALKFLGELTIKYENVRFDFIGIDYSNEKTAVTHIENAF